MVTSPTQINRRWFQRRGKKRNRSMQRYTQFDWLKSAQFAVGWGLIILVLGIASGIYLSQVSRTAIVGRNSEFLEEDLRELQFENSRMRIEISKAQSLQRMQSRTATANLPFVNPDPAKIQYLTVAVPAEVEAEAPVVAEAPPPFETMTDVLRYLLQQRVDRINAGVSSGE